MRAQEAGGSDHSSPSPLPNSLTCLYKKANERSCISKDPTRKKNTYIHCKVPLIEILFTFKEINIKTKHCGLVKMYSFTIVPNIYIRNGKKNINILFVMMTFF